MDYQKQTPDQVIEIFRSKGISPRRLFYYAQPQIFGSTAGPHGGLGGQTVSYFTVEAWVKDNQGPTVYICGDMYSYDESPFSPLKHISEWLPL